MTKVWTPDAASLAVLMFAPPSPLTCSAVQLYSSALEADSSVPLFYAKRAAAYQSLNKLGQALRDLDAALEVDGNYSTGYLHRGKLHRYAPALQCCVGLSGLLACMRVREGHGSCFQPTRSTCSSDILTAQHDIGQPSMTFD